MAYTKTITITDVQDEWLQSELQKEKNMTMWWEEQTHNIAQDVLTILETAPPQNVT